MRRVLSLLLGAAIVAAQPDARTIVVIGDLHMGPGRDSGGAWHAVEDFRWRDEFIRFLDALSAAGGNVDLVINGDLFELLQSPDAPCTGDGIVGCTDNEALQRLVIVTKAHTTELVAVGKFAAAGSNRVYIIPGDHDAALLIARVWQRALAAFAAPADRVMLVSSGSWRSGDGRVHIEHGHQLPLSANRFSRWPTPSITNAGRTFVERPWGEQAIVPFYDRVEARYPIVDNIAEEGVGAKFVAAALAEPPHDPAELLRLFLTKTTWQQFRMDLDDGEVLAPEWDLTKIRADLAAFVSTSLTADDPFAVTAKKLTSSALADIGTALTDQQIVAVCDYRAAIRRARRRMQRVLTQLAGVGPPITECSRVADTVGPAFEYYWRSRDRQVRDHIGQPQGLDAIVFGHTHLLDRPYRPFGDGGPVVVTSGAWQRTIHPNDIKKIDAPLESLPACYSFVQIAAAGARRTPQQRSWRLNQQQQWGMANGGC
ncbi:MAG: metallophosphoesterase [Vicinamibacterales bacterium]